MVDLNAVSIVMFIMSISLFLVGLLIRKTNCAELISGYEEKKDGKNKEFLAKLFGNGLILMGIILIITTILNYIISMGKNMEVIKRNSVIAICIFILNTILICIKMYYIMSKKRKDD